jgi:protoheme IX farnesyltransferase
MIAGARGWPGTAIAISATVGLALACGGASALNHVLDRDIDPLMGERTKRRPVASGRVSPSRALEFGLALSAFSFVLLASAVNVLTAVLALVGNLFYVVVYTRWLKRSTPQNIVIGGAAGAFPPLIGWAAATGGITLDPILLFLIIFFWTPPHFWALSLIRTDDYVRARVPMLPVVAGAEETRRQILLYSALLVPLGAAPWLFGFAGIVYGVTALLLGAMMIMLAYRVRMTREGAAAESAARRLFAFSILYLFVLFAVLLAENGLGGMLGPGA